MLGAALRLQPTIQNGRIYVGTQDGQVVCIDTGDKKLNSWSTWGGNAAHTGTMPWPHVARRPLGQCPWWMIRPILTTRRTALPAS